MAKKPTIKATTKRKGKDLVALARHVAEHLKEAAVYVGINDGAGNYEGTDVSVADVAVFNEFGTDRIPERSFIRASVYDNQGHISNWRELALKNMLEKGWSTAQGLSLIGLRVQMLIQNRIKQGIPPANAPRTLEKKARLKQGTTPLIATGQLMRSITFKVEVPDENVVIIPKENGEADGTGAE